MARVVATKRGHDGRIVREIGEEFDMPEGVKGSWFVPVGKAPPPAPEPDPNAQPPGAGPKKGSRVKAAEPDLA